MGMMLKDVELTDAQMEVLNPVIMKFSMSSRINKKKMEEECLKALEDAGLPLGGSTPKVKKSP